MATITLDLSLAQLIDTIKNLSSSDRKRILKVLIQLEEEKAIDAALIESLDDAENENFYSHESVMSEARAKYGL